MPAVPEVIYKYTDDIGVKCMGEGLVKFGHCDEYRKAEDKKGDPNENAFISKEVQIWDIFAGRPASFRLRNYLPGSIFCASMNGHAYGIFEYPYRIAIKTVPFLRALENAIKSRDFFRMIDSRPMPLEFWEKSKEIKNPNIGVHLHAHYVSYYDDISTENHPLAMMSAIRSDNMRNWADLGNNFPQVDVFSKSSRFLPEAEFRCVIGFADANEKPAKMGDGGIVLKDYDCRSPVFIRIRNPRRFFSLPF